MKGAHCPRKEEILSGRNLKFRIFDVAGLFVFLLKRKVDGYLGAILVSGQGIGAWIGGDWTIQKGEKNGFVFSCS